MLTELLTRETPHGLVLVFALPHYEATKEVRALVDTLLPLERGPIERALPRRQVTYAGGRFALRRVLERIGAPWDMPILADDRGAPILPPSVRGSISHKDGVAVALALLGVGHVGVDIERVPGPSDMAAFKILTKNEHVHVMKLADAERAFELSLRFSAKEAIYKALDPYVRRYVGYDEVETWPVAGGGVDVWSNVFPTGAQVSVRWEKLHDDRVPGLAGAPYVLTTARINV